MIFAVVELEFDCVMMDIGEASDSNVEMEDGLADMNAMGPSFLNFKVNPFLFVLLLQVGKHVPKVVNDLCINNHNVVAHFELFIIILIIEFD